MSIITIRGQMGSGATEIGRQIADRLHVDYVDREIIAKVAAQLQREEEEVMTKEMPPGSLIGRIVEALGNSGVDFQGAYVPFWQTPLGDTRYLQALEMVIKGLARSESLVIQGRGSQFILKDHPGALHVLVVAPMDVRVKRVMQELHLNQEAAKREIANYESSRREFIKRYFKADREDPVSYDLIVNTGYFTYQAATSLIVGALPLKG